MKHLKLSLLTALLMACSVTIYAQATITSTVIEKENRNAVMIVIDKPADVTMDALEQRLKRSGLTGKSHNGVTIYKGVTLSEINTAKIDLYTKVEKGSSDKSSVVYIAVSQGYDNFIDSKSDSVTTDHIKAFLNSFVSDVNMYSLDMMIANQLALWNASQKDYEQLLNNKKELEKKKADLESSLVDIERKIQEKKTESDLMKDSLEKLKAQKTGSGQ